MFKKIYVLALTGICSFAASGQEFDWGFGIGGSSTELMQAITASGSATYVTGQFGSQNLDFDHSSELNLVSPEGGYDIFLAKYDRDGDLVWVKTIRGTGFISSYDLVLDDNGKILVTGGYNGTVNFNSDGNHELTAQGGSDAFVAKFDTSGTFESVFTIPGHGNTSGYAIDLDQDGNIYLAGNLSDSADFDPSIDSIFVSNDPGGLFLAKYSAGWVYQWGWGITGVGGTDVKDIDVSPTGDVVLTGLFQQTVDLDPGPGIAEFTADDVDSYVLKVNTNGAYQWASTFTGNGNQVTFGIDIDGLYDIYVCGRFNSEIDLDPTNGQEIIPSPTSATAFLTKLDSSGAYQWGRYVANQGDGVFIDVEGFGFFGVQVVGTFNGTIYLPDSTNVFSTGGKDIVQMEFSSSGAYDKHLIFGGTTNDDLNTGCTYFEPFEFQVGGHYYGTIDFAPGQDTLSGPTSAGDTDLFLAKYIVPLTPGVNETAMHSLVLYPNPASDLMMVSTNLAWTNYTLSDMSGRVVRSKPRTNNSIDLSNLPKGMYALTLIAQNEAPLQTLVVKE